MIRRRRKPPEPSWMPPPISRQAWDALTARVDKISDICAAGYEASNVPVPAWLQSPATEPDYSPPASHPEAESLPLGAADDVMLAGWSLDLWPNDEFELIVQSVKPVLAGPVYYCPRCGSGSSAGPCGCGGRA